MNPYITVVWLNIRLLPTDTVLPYLFLLNSVFSYLSFSATIALAVLSQCATANQLSVKAHHNLDDDMASQK